MDIKVRYSHQREQIYNYLMSVDTHPTAEDIYFSLKNDMPELSIATVYRNLKQLESLNLVKRIQCDSIKERYDAKMDNHSHFICEKCGKVFDLENINFESIASNPILDECMIKKINLSFTGICPKCK